MPMATNMHRHAALCTVHPALSHFSASLKSRGDPVAVRHARITRIPLYSLPMMKHCWILITRCPPPTADREQLNVAASNGALPDRAACLASMRHASQRFPFLISLADRCGEHTFGVHRPEHFQP